MKKYRLKLSEIEVKTRDWEEGRFYSLDEPWYDGNSPKVVGVYDSLEEARSAARDFALSKPRYMGDHYLVEELYTEEVIWDDDLEEWEYVDSCDGYTYYSQK